MHGWYGSHSIADSENLLRHGNYNNWTFIHAIHHLWSRELKENKKTWINGNKMSRTMLRMYTLNKKEKRPQQQGSKITAALQKQYEITQNNSTATRE
jgi:hypothetical protein